MLWSIVSAFREKNVTEHRALVYCQCFPWKERHWAPCSDLLSVLSVKRTSLSTVLWSIVSVFREKNVTEHRALVYCQCFPWKERHWAPCSGLLSVLSVKRTSLSTVLWSIVSAFRKKNVTEHRALVYCQCFPWNNVTEPRALVYCQYFPWEERHWAPCSGLLSVLSVKRTSLSTVLWSIVSAFREKNVTEHRALVYCQCFPWKERHWAPCSGLLSVLSVKERHWAQGSSLVCFHCTERH